MDAMQTIPRLFLDFMQMREFAKDPLVFVGGEGIRLTDTAGRRYIDGLSGVFVCSLGHGNMPVIEAMAAQARQLAFAPPLHGTTVPALQLTELGNYGLDIRVLDGEVGQASGLKMCYAAMTKGLQALGAELLVAARLLGVEQQLRAEQNQGGDLAAVRRFVESALPNMPPKAYRWIGEMEEIARCFEELGLPGRLMFGAADVYTNFRDGGVLAQELSLERPITAG